MVITGPFALIYVPNKLIMRRQRSRHCRYILRRDMFRLAILAISLGR